MKDIQVDENGDLRCATCGGKHFQDRRTGTAHVVGFVTVGIGALATRKKLRCKLCGAYNRQGNAQPYRPADVKVPTAAQVDQADAQRRMAKNAEQRRQRMASAPSTPRESTRDGQFLTVKKPGPRRP